MCSIDMRAVHPLNQTPIQRPSVNIGSYANTCGIATVVFLQSCTSFLVPRSCLTPESCSCFVRILSRERSRHGPWTNHQRTRNEADESVSLLPVCGGNEKVYCTAPCTAGPQFGSSQSRFTVSAIRAHTFHTNSHTDCMGQSTVAQMAWCHKTARAPARGTGNKYETNHERARNEANTGRSQEQNFIAFVSWFVLSFNSGSTLQKQYCTNTGWHWL